MCSQAKQGDLYIKQNKNVYFNNKYIFDNIYRSYRKSVINNVKQIMV